MASRPPGWPIQHQYKCRPVLPGGEEALENALNHSEVSVGGNSRDERANKCVDGMSEEMMSEREQRQTRGDRVPRAPV